MPVKEPVKKILVIDNHVVTLKYLELILGKEGYRVRTAQDGIEALDIIKDYKPDVFFVDLVMPYIRGEKLIPLLRNMDDLRDAKIVVLSGIAAEIESDHLTFGADACIAKAPFNKMGKYVLDLLGRFNRGEAAGPIEDVIGVEEVYKRAVTTELIAGRRHTDVILNNISDGIVECTRDHRIVYANAAAMNVLGGDETEVISAPFESFWCSENAAAVKGYLDGTKEHGGKPAVTLQKDDSFYEIHARFLVTENDETFIIILKDITLFERELTKKDTMVKEVYHRVKNNLVLVSSIINLQIGESADKNEQNVLHDLKNRIDSIALIHSKIFSNNNPDRLPLREYVEELLETLIYSEGETVVPVSYTVSVPDVQLSADAAVPFGLIITELTSNALKYAFTDSVRGKISCTGTVSEEGILSFVFHSDGKAPAEYFSFSESSLLSLRLVDALASQLQNGIVFTEDKGAVYSFSVPL